jgi:hypothetical protein
MSLQPDPISPKRIQPPPQPKAAAKVIAPSVFDGEEAAQATLKLADEYKKAAGMLYGATRKKDPLSLAPWRLLAIHAIELYLNAFLISKGSTGKALRCMQHNFGERAKLALDAKLVLKKKTADHLISITEKREYVVSRYDAGTEAELSKISRLTATLEEISAKVTATIAN